VDRIIKNPLEENYEGDRIIKNPLEENYEGDKIYSQCASFVPAIKKLARSED